MKPTAVRRDWGGVLGGPIVKNKAHFFVSLERQVDNPNRSRPFDQRPDLNFAIAEDRTDWNTLIRFDHQINPNHTWAVRWLREDAPQWNTVGTRQTLKTLQDEDRPRSDGGRPERARQRPRQIAGKSR